MDKRLEEQLERVRMLSERVAQIHEQLERNTRLMRGHAAAEDGPPCEVRQFRTGASEGDSVGSSGVPPRSVAADRPRRVRRR